MRKEDEVEEMTAKANSVLTFLQQDEEVIRLQDILEQKQELVIYGLYEGQRTLVAASLLTAGRQIVCWLFVILQNGRRNFGKI